MRGGGGKGGRILEQKKEEKKEIIRTGRQTLLVRARARNRQKEILSRTEGKSLGEGA